MVFSGVFETSFGLVNCQVGTDIEDFKCSWLVVKSLELATEEQKKILYVSKKLIINNTLCWYKNLFRMIIHMCFVVSGELWESR